MTRQPPDNGKQRTDVLSRLCRAIYISVPLGGTQRCCLLRTVFWHLSSALCLLSSGAHAVEGTRPAYIPPPPAVSSGNILQIIFSLLLVLAAIVLVAWLLKRMNVVRQGSGSLLKVLGGTSIGQRERIVLVEVKDTWLVIGVGPGQIRTLHTLDRPEGIAQQHDDNSSQAEKDRFSTILSNILGQHASKQRPAAKPDIDKDHHVS